MESVVRGVSQKRRGMNYRELAVTGESPVQCKDCRYNKSEVYRAVTTVNVCRKRLFNETSEYAVERKERRRPKGAERSTLKTVYKNPMRGHLLDPEYCCGYGLPPVVHRPEKPMPIINDQIDPAKAEEMLNEHLKATGQIDGDVDGYQEEGAPAPEAAPEQQERELPLREAGNANDDEHAGTESGYRDTSGVVHY